MYEQFLHTYLLTEHVLLQKSESKKKGWRNNHLLTAKLSDTDTSDEEKRWEKRKMKLNEKNNSRYSKSYLIFFLIHKKIKQKSFFFIWITCFNST